MNRLDLLKDKLKKREKIFGVTMSIPLHNVLSVLASQEPDFIVFDFEHGPFNTELAVSLFNLCRLMDITTVVRVQDSLYHLIAKPVDFGADGIMLPRTESLEQVKTAVEALRFHPYGKKGFAGGPVFRKNETFDDINHNRLLFIQIESPKGVETLPQMLEKYGDDIVGVIIGPYDLSIMVNTPLELRSSAIMEQIEEIIKICDSKGKSCGIYCNDEKDAEYWYGKGINLLWTACDLIYMEKGYAKAVSKIKGL